MRKRDSMLETIAEATAQTITEVSKLYRDMERGETSHDDDSNQADSSEKRTRKTEENRSYPFGTPFSDIVRFTSEVEVFTRHIDSFTREHFSHRGDGKQSAKSDGRREKD
ncbi:MAG: hypothetical protein LUD84_00995 [Clostridiales bacterium]|nr:hypothetical protein [Clostridiales bacterium]